MGFDKLESAKNSLVFCVSSNLYALFVNGNVPFISYEKIAASASDLRFFLVISEYLRKFSISEINAKESIDILSGKSLTS